MQVCKPAYRAIDVMWSWLVISLIGACSSDSNIEYVDERTVSNAGTIIQWRGALKDGKKHGSWYLYWNGNRQRMETWKDGVQHGVELSWYSSGPPLGDAYYKDGKLHGRGRAFGGDDNRLIRLTWWWRGLQHGYWCIWSDDGQLVEVEKYHRGRLLFSEKPARRDCPYTSTLEGQHHFDPADRTYTRPYPRTGGLGIRPLAVPGR